MEKKFQNYHEFLSKNLKNEKRNAVVQKKESKNENELLNIGKKILAIGHIGTHEETEKMVNQLLKKEVFKLNRRELFENFGDISSLEPVRNLNSNFSSPYKLFMNLTRIESIYTFLLAWI